MCSTTIGRVKVFKVDNFKANLAFWNGTLLLLSLVTNKNNNHQFDSSRLKGVDENIPSLQVNAPLASADQVHISVNPTDACRHVNDDDRFLFRIWIEKWNWKLDSKRPELSLTNVGLQKNVWSPRQAQYFAHNTEIKRFFFQNTSEKNSNKILDEKLKIFIFGQWGMQAQWPNWQKLVANKWIFIAQKIVLIFFLRHGLSYKLDFRVIKSLKQYLLKNIFV